MRRSAMARITVLTGLGMVLSGLSGAAWSGPARAETGEAISTAAGPVIVETFADGLVHPWGLDFLPDGSMLVTERPGRVRAVTPEGAVSAPLAGAPRTQEWGQGGMLDIAVAPDFATSREVYIAYSAIDGRSAGTALWRGRLAPDGTAFEDGETIFRMNRLTSNARHFGARIVFAEDGETLWLTIGDRGHRERAQDPQDHTGSVIRLNRDGSVPADNPHATGGAWLPEIWSIGHRNAQGAFRHPETGALWTVSHGARGGDEINIPEAGKNYGWPIISYGRHYSGQRIGRGTEAPGLEQPIHYWDPSIAPSGAMIYTGDAFPDWRGDLFVGALRDRLLARLDLDGERVTGEERLMTGMGHRVRDVVQGPDGLIYLLTDAPDGYILRLYPGR